MRYDLDPDASRVVIHASSSVHPIETEAPLTGWIELTVGDDGTVDPAAPVAAHVEVPLGGLRSGNPLIDREADRRLDTRHHPTVTGDLQVLTPATDAAAGDGDLAGIGDLTLKGVTAPIDGTLHVEATDDAAIALTGETTFEVTDFGVQPPSLLLVKVHATVRVTLDAVARPAAD
ncbi:MAG: YceI family protein [Acidimicrobiales bacterium]